MLDPGITPTELETMRARLAREGVRVTYVVVTHSHHDHLRGWSAFPGARIVMPRIGADKAPERRTRILAGKAQVDRKLGVEDPHFEYPTVDHKVDDVSQFKVGDLTLEVRHLPGHSDCTCVVFVPELATLFTADYLVHPGLPYCRFEVAPFEASLRWMRAAVTRGEVSRVIPAHEAPIEGEAALLAALDEELGYFEFLRAELTRRLASAAQGVDNENDERILRAVAADLDTRRRARTGDDVGRRAIQDLDNARRTLADLRSR